MARWLLVSWATNAVALAVAGALLGGVSFHGSVSALIVASAVFGVLNTILKPIMRLLTLPLAVVTLGVAWFFVSLMMLWLTDVLVHNFSISGFWDYVWATVIVWASNLVLDLIFRPRKRRAATS